MPLDPRTPVLVGVAHVAQKFADPREAQEPLALMVDASRKAGEDAGAPSLLERADAVRVTRGRWRYEDPARVVAERLGCPSAQTGISPYGGNMVQAMLSASCREILAGERDIVLLTGAEVGYSQAKSKAQGVTLSFSEAPGEPDWRLGPEKPMVHEAEIARGVGAPIQVYAMFENAIRHARGETLDEHIVRVSELWAGFSRVAAGNPHAWIRDARSAEEIRTPSPTNRMVGFPYPKLMNSNNAVDQGAALLLCSLEAARRAGVPEDRFVFPHAGTDADDHAFVSNRDELHLSPAIRIAGERCLELADTPVDALDHVDVYSCFPSAVQVAATALGLSQERPLTVTGGLTFGGGPLNNYVMHSIARMAERLREAPGSRGLITANGGLLSKHAFGVYSTEPPSHPFGYANPQDEVDALPKREVVAEHDGAATLESYTVLFGKDGPERAHAVFRLEDGRRAWANSEDADLMDAMTERREEFCGRAARIDGAGRFTVTH